MIKKIKKKPLSLPMRKLKSVGQKSCVDVFLFGAESKKIRNFLAIKTYQKHGATKYYSRESIERKVEAAVWLWTNGYMKDIMIKISCSRKVENATKFLAKKYASWL